MRPEGPFVVFVNFADQRLYAYEPGAEPRPHTRVLRRRRTALEWTRSCAPNGVKCGV